MSEAIVLERKPGNDKAVTLDCFDALKDEGTVFFWAVTPEDKQDAAALRRVPLTIPAQRDAATTAPRACVFPADALRSSAAATDAKETTTDAADEAPFILCETLHLSVDPYMRCRFNDDTGVDYASPYGVGSPITGLGVGVVVASSKVQGSSNDEKEEEKFLVAPGTVLTGGMDWSWQTYNLFTPETAPFFDWTPTRSGGKLPGGLSAVPPSIPPSWFLGILGVTGLTAYFGLFRALKAPLCSSDVVVVSAAAGGTGMAACQFARLCGAKVIGIAGSREKCAVLTDKTALDAADAAVCYKDEETGRPLSEDALVASLHAAVGKVVNKAPRAAASTCGGTSEEKEEEEDACGVTVYFDNVGGTVSNAVIRCMGCNANNANAAAAEQRAHPEIVLCGQVSVYNEDVPYPPPMEQRILGILTRRNVRRERYVVLSYTAEFDAAIAIIAEWVSQGKVRNKETVSRGLRSAPAAFVGMMAGNNVGKAVVEL